MAQIAGGTSHAGEVAARTGLTLEGTHPRDRLGDLRGGRGRRGGPREAPARPRRVAHRLRRARGSARVSTSSPGTSSSSRPGRSRWTGSGRSTGSGTGQGELPRGVGHLPRELGGEGRGHRQRVRHGAPRPEDEVRDRPELRLRHHELPHEQRPGGLEPQHDASTAATSPAWSGAASDNAEGGPGACFDCVVIPYKIGFAGANSTSVDEKFVRDLTEALVAAGDSDGAVINMSLGTSRDHAPLRAAVDYARSKGKIVVASAGNSQLGRQGPAGVPNYPGAYPGVIAVAADASRRQHRALLDQRRLRGHRRAGRRGPLDLGLAASTTPRPRRPTSSPPTGSATRCSRAPRWRRRSSPASRP